MGIKYERTGNALFKVKNKLQTLDVVLGRELEFARGEIVKRAASGLGYDDNKLRGYSDGYKKQRQRQGYSTSVNLTLTGNMLRSISSRIEKNADKVTGLIFPFGASPSGVAPRSRRVSTHAQRVEWTNRLRPWFALSKAQVKRITQAIQEHFKS